MKSYFLTGLLCISIVAIYYLYSYPQREVSLVVESFRPRSIKNPVQSDKSTSRINKLSSSKDSINKFIRNESLRIGKIDPQPEKTQERLKTVALELNLESLETLGKNSLDRSKNGDERFLSVFLLSESENKEAVPILKDIAKAHITSIKTNWQFEEELMIRMQALQGLKNIADKQEQKEFLGEYLSQQSNAYLAQQAKKLLR